jgi:hypothetical protein
MSAPRELNPTLTESGSYALQPRHSSRHASAPEVSAWTQPPQFKSFWLGGFESACHINSRRCRLDMTAATQHDRFAEPDYARLKSLGIHGCRDGVRWHLIEKRPGQYEFGSLLPMVRAARRQRMQVIWNLCHYGWPEDIDLFSGAFVTRFARFARAVARVIANESDDVPYYAPMNEISYFAWAIAVGGYMYPYAGGTGMEIKRQLIRATIAATDAVREVDRRARFVKPDPVIHVVAPRGRPDLEHAAAIQRQWQFHAWDMLCGRMEPELGGREEYLDIVGVNYYHSNQFEHPDVRLRWEDEPRDERWVPLHLLLKELSDRYGRPMLMTETSHFGSGRARWIREIADEACKARACGVPLHGVCLYPILDRQDWEDPSHWHNSGLFDLEQQSDGTLKRQINAEYAAAFQDCRLMTRQRIGCV